MHKEEKFDLEHVRSHKARSDAKFWMKDHRDTAEDSIHLDVENDHSDFEDSSDSELDWAEYQAYLSGQYHQVDEELVHSPVIHEAAPAEVHLEPAVKESKPEVLEQVVAKEVESEEGSMSEDDRPHVRDGRQHDEEYLKHKEAYKAWKHERKQQLKEESYRQHHERHGHSFDSDASDKEDYDSYLDYKQRKWERKQHHRHHKDDKHYHAHRDLWTSHESPEHYRRTYEAEYEEARPRHHRRSYDSGSDSEELIRGRHHTDYRHWKYTESLPEKERDVADKQRDADERYVEFCNRHPYMGKEELSLHRKHYEVEPYFETKEDKKAWKMAKKEEKMIRAERLSVLKH